MTEAELAALNLAEATEEDHDDDDDDDSWMRDVGMKFPRFTGNG